MRRIVGLAFLIVCGALASPAFAETETAAQATARVNVETRAAVVGVAPTEAQALKDQAKLLPAVKEAVAVGATQAVMEHTKNPSVLADLLKYVKHKVKREGGKTKHKKPSLAGPPGGEPAEVGPVKRAKASRVHHLIAHAATCWGDVGNWEEFAVAPGAIVAWLYIRAQGWCGNGYSMEWLGGSFGTQWSWGDFCWAGLGENYSWDVPWSWVHMARWGSLGVGYPWGCWGLWGSKVPIRIAANGYYDFYNDFGF